MVKQVTINLYEKCYHKLCSNGLKNNFEFTELQEILKQFNIKESTMNTYYKSLIYFNKKHNNILTEQCHTDIQNDMKRINQKVFLKASKGQLNESQKNNYLRWEDIISVYYMIQEQEQNLKKVMLLSVFVLFPPRRILDYQEMIYCKKKPLIVDENKNYLVLNKHPYFIFNRYKTDKKYKTQIIEINNKELINLFLLYVSKYNIQPNTSLFNINYNNFTHTLRNTFYKYTNKFVSVNLLRHAFISYQTRQNKINLAFDRQMLAHTMAHSTITNLNYYVDENI